MARSAVEEVMCLGRIESIGFKSLDRERARKMTEAGRAILAPDLKC